MEIEMIRFILNDRICEALSKALKGDKEAAREWSDLVAQAEELDLEWLRDLRARHRQGERLSNFEREQIGLPVDVIPVL